MTTLSLAERLNVYGERRSSKQGDIIFLPQTTLQHFPELGDGVAIQTYAQLANQSNGSIVPYEIIGGGISTRFSYLPTGKARIVSFGNLVKELELDFVQSLELERDLKQKASI